MPNGRTLDYVADAPYGSRVGIEKQSFVSGLFATGAASSNYAPPGTDPDADLTRWYALINAGEPYDSNPHVADIIDEITSHHSSYYIDHSEAPAPLLISNGWTDDLFPPDEAIRFYNRTRTQCPGAQLNLFFMDYGHQRGQNKPADIVRCRPAGRLVRLLPEGTGRAAPGRSRDADQGLRRALRRPLPRVELGEDGPRARSADSAPLSEDDPASGAPTIGQAFDPITGGGACAPPTAPISPARRPTASPLPRAPATR